jgi:hypothetical protein
LGVLIAGATPARAQTLPFFDAQIPDCVKTTMEKTEYKTEEKAKAFCKIVDMMEASAREELEKKWKATPSGVRLKCIAETGNSYSMLSFCIDQALGNCLPHRLPPTASLYIRD